MRCIIQKEEQKLNYIISTNANSSENCFPQLRTNYKRTVLVFTQVPQARAGTVVKCQIELRTKCYVLHALCA